MGQQKRVVMEENTEYRAGAHAQMVYTEDQVVGWSCPLCGEKESQPIKTERGLLTIAKCNSCSLIRVDPRLKDPHEFYQGNIDGYREEFRLVVEGKPHHRDWNYKKILNLLAEYKPSGRFLDIGTNAGGFLRLARDRNWDIEGVEPSPQLGSLAREWWGLKIHEGFLEGVGLPDDHYDIVTMTDVFEHVVNPKDVLAESHRILKKDGILFLKVPNGLFNIVKYKVRKLLGKSAEADDFDSYEHVCHYTHKTLSKMLESNGYRVLKLYAEAPIQTPTWHFYVGHYYQHRCPFSLHWKTKLARLVLYRLSQLEEKLRGEVGWLAPNLGCIATPIKD